MPPLKFMDTAEEVRRAAEARRRELGVSQRAVSLRAGYAHAAYWWWMQSRRTVSLEAALCYLRTLGLRVVLHKDTPLVRSRKNHNKDVP